MPSASGNLPKVSYPRLLFPPSRAATQFQKPKATGSPVSAVRYAQTGVPAAIFVRAAKRRKRLTKSLKKRFASWFFGKTNIASVKMLCSIWLLMLVPSQHQVFALRFSRTRITSFKSAILTRSSDLLLLVTILDLN